MHADDDADPAPDSVDLHGLRPDQALRRLAQELHAIRVRGRTRLRVITGRGWGNLEQKPVLRKKVEEWLRGPDGQGWGVVEIEVVARGGALDVSLGPPGESQA